MLPIPLKFGKVAKTGKEAIKKVKISEIQPPIKFSNQPLKDFPLLVDITDDVASFLKNTKVSKKTIKDSFDKEKKLYAKDIAKKVANPTREPKLDDFIKVNRSKAETFDPKTLKDLKQKTLTIKSYRHF